MSIGIPQALESPYNYHVRVPIKYLSRRQHLYLLFLRHWQIRRRKPSPPAEIHGRGQDCQIFPLGLTKYAGWKKVLLGIGYHFEVDKKFECPPQRQAGRLPRQINDEGAAHAPHERMPRAHQECADWTPERLTTRAGRAQWPARRQLAVVRLAFSRESDIE